MTHILWILLFFVLSGCGPDAPSSSARDVGSDRQAPLDAGAPDGKLSDLTGPDAKTCAKPLPFMPPAKPVGWKHTSTKLLVVTQGAANHRAQDVVLVSGAPQLLIGKNRGQKGTKAVTSSPQHLPAAKAMPAASVKAPPDTFGW